MSNTVGTNPMPSSILLITMVVRYLAETNDVEVSQFATTKSNSDVEETSILGSLTADSKLRRGVEVPD
jgi:hypothetical protein